MLASEPLRRELAAARALGLSVIPVHSGDHFPRDALTHMIDCSPSELLGHDVAEEDDEDVADGIHDLRRYLFRENIRDVLNNSHPEACQGTLRELGLRAAEARTRRFTPDNVPQEHYKHDIFISYNARDAWEVYESIAAVFEGLSLRVFNPSKDLQRTQVSSAEMVKHVKGSDLLLQINTPNYPLSKWCRAELFAAEDAEIPVFVVYAGKKHTAGQLLGLLDAPAERGSKDEEDINRAKASIKRAVALRGMKDAYNPDFAANAAEGLQDIALQALSKMRCRRRLRLATFVLLALAACAVAVFVYTWVVEASMDTYCETWDAEGLNQTLHLVPWSSRKAYVERCLVKIRVELTLDRARHTLNVTRMVQDIVKLAGKYSTDLEIMDLIITGIQDAHQVDPTQVATNRQIVEALVHSIEGVLDSQNSTLQARQEFVAYAVEALARLAETDPTVMLEKASPIIPRILEMQEWHIQQWMLTLLMRMTKRKNMGAGRPDFASAAWVGNLVKVMSTFGGHVAIQERAAKILRNLVHATDKKVRIQATLVDNITKVIFGALEKHEDRELILDRGLDVLAALARGPHEALALCKAGAVTHAVGILQKWLSARWVAIPVMQLIDRSGTVPSCTEQAVSSGAVSILGHSLRLLCRDREVVLLGLASMARLAEDLAGRKAIENLTLDVVMNASHIYIQDEEVDSLVGHLLAMLAQELKESRNETEQAHILTTMFKAVQSHDEDRGLIESAVLVVQNFSQGPQGGIVMNYSTGEALERESTVVGAELVLSKLQSNSTAVQVLLRLIDVLSPPDAEPPKKKAIPTRRAAAARLIGALATRFGQLHQQSVAAVLVGVADRHEVVQDAARLAVIELGKHKGNVLHVVAGLLEAMESPDVHVQNTAVKSLVRLGEAALDPKNGSATEWGDVNAALQAGIRENKTAMQSGVLQSLAQLAKSLDSQSALEWMGRALDIARMPQGEHVKVKDNIDYLFEEITDRLENPTDPTSLASAAAAADLLRAAFHDPRDFVRRCAFQYWFDLAEKSKTAEYMEQALPEVLERAGMEPDPDQGSSELYAAMAAIRILGKVPGRCVEVLAVVNRTLARGGGDPDVRKQAVKDMKSRGVRSIFQKRGPCREAVISVLKAREAQDADPAVRYAARRAQRKLFCQKGEPEAGQQDCPPRLQDGSSQDEEKDDG